MSDKDIVEITVEEGAAIVKLRSSSISNTEQVISAAEPIYTYIEENQPSTIVIDFDGVKFFSSEVLGMLIALRSKVKAYGGEVVISAIEPQLYRVFKITNLDRIFKFFPDRKSAVESIKRK